ncbi:MAG: TIGR03936 family radical SAM-associated protein [Caldilinea sp.]|nr:TIGR03936 family radical SAM-associated protein [Caldilinea sp.]MDW8442772.1 TIGR03936 family radical SAM-associated protein [Caldilineaceae bacterium]
MDETQLPLRQRIRICYAKGEAIKFISHHDEFRLWERALRRADLPLLYKQGFNPQPHIQFAAALGVGITGVNELLDIVLAPPVSLDEVAARLRAKLPPAVTLHALEEVPLNAPPLQTLVIGADYTILLYAAPGEIPEDLLAERIADFLARTTIWRERERKGKRYTYNLRPLVFELRYLGYDPTFEEHRIFLRVQARSGATGRPDEVVDALGFDDFARTLRRERLYFADNEEDVAVMAQYPLISQEQIAAPRGVRGESLRRPAPAVEIGPREGQRSINERAVDEFI